MNILFLIPSLDLGGSERQLVELAKGLHQRGHEVTVAVFHGQGALEGELREAGVTLIDLHMGSRWQFLGLLWRLLALLRARSPRIIYGCLGTPNLFTVLLKPWFPEIRMVWGVRSSRTDLDRCGWSWRACHRVESRLARFADLVISNSAAGLERAVASGFPRATLRVVPSGINVERFYPDAQAGAAVRAQWDLRRDHCLIGLVGRLDPREDHPVFLRAAALLASPAYYPHHSPGR